MSIFKKIFGGSDNSDKKSGDQKLDIERLLLSADKNKSVIEIDNSICKLCVWGDELDKLTEPQKKFIITKNLSGRLIMVVLINILTTPLETLLTRLYYH